MWNSTHWQGSHWKPAHWKGGDVPVSTCPSHFRSRHWHPHHWQDSHWALCAGTPSDGSDYINLNITIGAAIQVRIERCTGIIASVTAATPSVSASIDLP